MQSPSPSSASTTSDERSPAHPDDETPPGTLQSADGLCPRCGGSGRVDGTECPGCQGTGTVTVIVGDA